MGIVWVTVPLTIVFGTVWLKFIAEIPWEAAFMGGFAPFIGIWVRKRLKSASLLYVASH